MGSPRTSPAALEALGLNRIAPADEALFPLLAVSVPTDVDEAGVRRRLLLQHGIEISGGLGPLAGLVWRIGVMGVGAALEPQRRLIGGLAEILGADPSEPLEVLQEQWS